MVTGPIAVLLEFVGSARSSGGGGGHAGSGAGQKPTACEGLGLGLYGLSDGGGGLVCDGFHSFSLDGCACKFL
jgi:hypothetical protein